MSKRKVIRVKLHDVKTLIPGIGNANNELPPINKSTKLEMVEGLHGIEVTIPGQNQVTVLPYANVQIYFVEKETAEAVSLTLVASKK